MWYAHHDSVLRGEMLQTVLGDLPPHLAALADQHLATHAGAGLMVRFEGTVVHEAPLLTLAGENGSWDDDVAPAASTGEDDDDPRPRFTACRAFVRIDGRLTAIDISAHVPPTLYRAAEAEALFA